MPNKKIPSVNTQDDQPIGNIYTRNLTPVTQQQSEESTLQQGEEVETQYSNTAIPQEGKTTKATIYLTAELKNKLKELEIEYWNRHHKEIDRNKILRHLLEKCTIDDLEDIQAR